MNDAERMASLRRAVYGIWACVHALAEHPQVASTLEDCESPICRMIAREYRASGEPGTGGKTP